MNITLKQSDIEKAVRQYLGTQVNLRGKDVAMAFTNGRKENGISVELEITDSPNKPTFDPEGNFGDFLEMVGAPLGGCVIMRASAPAEEEEETKVSGETEAEASANVVEQPAAEGDDLLKATVTSLFGK
jgi:hypothetical protein